MKPVDQTKIGKDRNCFQAALASILDMRLEDVPDFCNLYPTNWIERVRIWLREEWGLEYLTVGMPDEVGFIEEVAPHCHHLMSGLNPEHTLLHTVVAFGGTLVHDPNPKRGGCTKSSIDVFCIDPMRIVALQVEIVNLKKQLEETRQRYI